MKKTPSKKLSKKAVKKAENPKTVLVLRTCQADGSSHGCFKWPLEVGATVSAPDWVPIAECGNGLHGWLWGCGNWNLKAEGNDILWYVLEVAASAIVDLDGKVKFPTCRIKAIEKRWDLAMAYIRGHCDLAAESVATGDSGHASATGNFGHASATGNFGHASATGNSGHASAPGNSGHASATGNFGHASATGNFGHASATGNFGHASATGNSGHASATGYSGHASATGDSGHASATGYSGHASATGDFGHASATGNFGWAISNRGKAKAGKDGIITIRWKDGERFRVVTGYVGSDGIQADVWYHVENGKLMPCEPE